MKYKVLIVQRRLTHYRTAFFEALKRECHLNDIDLVLAHGDGTADEVKKNDAGSLSWAIHLPTKYFLNGGICWQPYGNLLSGVNLLVVTSENKLICNLYHQFFNKNFKFVFWGHGANLQGNPNGLKEKFKRKTIKYADWWFGYTSMSIPLILKSGFPQSRITVLNNAIDTGELSMLCSNVNEEEKKYLKQKYDLIDKSVGIYIGSLYEEKRVDFLLEAAELIYQHNSNFRLIIIGGGQQKSVVENFCATHKWAIYVGVCKGQEKAKFLSIADVMLNPGLVGLGILDSFVARVPMLTTDCGSHSPEISYLVSGQNGIMTPNSLDDYVATVEHVLSTPTLLRSLQQGCLASAREYTVENMAKNFTQGLLQCLATSALRV